MKDAKDKVELIIRGMTREQAKVFAEWFEGQGEQDQGVWFDDREVQAPMTNVGRKGGYLEEKGDTFIMHVK